MLQSTPQCKQRKLEKSNLISIALFPCLFLGLLLLPPGLGSFLCHDAEHPSMQATQARKILKSYLYRTLSLSIFGLAFAAPRAGIILFHGAEKPSMRSMQARKISKS